MSYQATAGGAAAHREVDPGTTFPPEGTCLMCALPYPCPTALLRDAVPPEVEKGTT